MLPSAPRTFFAGPQPRTLLAAQRRRLPWHRPHRASSLSLNPSPNPALRRRPPWPRGWSWGRRIAADDTGGGRGRGGEGGSVAPCLVGEESSQSTTARSTGTGFVRGRQRRMVWFWLVIVWMNPSSSLRSSSVYTRIGAQH
jgi:hypothetical protein